jgi:phosphoribosylamine--glycine ligase
MKRQNIPTAEYRNFSDANDAIKYAKSRPLPVVIKADGLAAGKGVIIAENEDQIESAINEIMVQQGFGSAGSKVVIEDFLKGQEVSMHALSDGITAVMFPPSQDHKQIFDGDRGPNTGGMGVIAPIDWVSVEILNQVKTQVVEPALKGLSDDGAEFSGVLYPGLMIDGDNLKVLEFNARFGDPEAEVYMRLIECDLYQVLSNCARGQLDPSSVKWKPGYAATVILASKGYPGSYQKGDIITGIDDAQSDSDVIVFHAGTKFNESGELVTAGGRVLNVTAVGQTLEQALNKAYAAVDKIHFEGMQYRKDIGQRLPAIN